MENRSLLALVTLPVLTIFFFQSCTTPPPPPTTSEQVSGGDKLPEAVSKDLVKSILYGTWGSGMSEGGVISQLVSPLNSSEVRPEYGFSISKLERGSPLDAWEETDVSFGTPYKVWGTGQLWSKHLFVYGKSSNGDSVIEQWTFPDVTGAWTVAATTATTPIGQPGPIPSSHTASINGGVYIPYAQRSAPGAIRRKELYRGSSPTVASATFDLDRRFVMFLGEDVPGLYSLDITATTPSATLLWSVTDMPELAIAEDICVMQHSVNGRCYQVDFSEFTSQGYGGAIIWDYDNDGYPDDYTLFKDDEYDTLFPYSVWDRSQLPWAQDF